MKPSIWISRIFLIRKTGSWACKMKLQCDSIFLFLKNVVVMLWVGQLWKYRKMATYADIE